MRNVHNVRTKRPHLAWFSFTDGLVIRKLPAKYVHVVLIKTCQLHQEKEKLVKYSMILLNKMRTAGIREHPICFVEKQYHSIPSVNHEVVHTGLYPPLSDRLQTGRLQGKRKWSRRTH